MQYK